MTFLLDQHDRNRFAEYCEHEAHSTRGLVEQMEKLPGTAIIAKQFRAEAMAFAIVAKKLRSIEDASVETPS